MPPKINGESKIILFCTFDEATAVCTAPAISGWIAARICATSEEVDNEEEDEEEDEEEAEDEEDEEEKDDEELDEEEEIIWIALFTWLSQISCNYKYEITIFITRSFLAPA